MAAIDKIVEELRRPFTPEAMHFKIQGKSGASSTLIVSYIDGRQVGERLNTVCPAQWRDDYTPILAASSVLGVQCAIGIAPAGTGGYYVERCDVGIAEGGIGGLKAVYSDAFKRAGVKWGIGVSNYYVPRFYAKNNDLDRRGDKTYLSNKVVAQARAAYAAWLKAEGVARFGQPLDLGDTALAQGDAEVVPEGDPSLQGDVPPVAAITTTRMRNAYKRFAQRTGDEAEKKLKVWLNSQGFPPNFDDIEDPTTRQTIFDYMENN